MGENLLVTVARALVEVGVVAAQGGLAEGGDLAQTRQPQKSPARVNIYSESVRESESRTQYWLLAMLYNFFGNLRNFKNPSVENKYESNVRR